jgi:hypothetical protein
MPVGVGHVQGCCDFRGRPKFAVKPVWRPWLFKQNEVFMPLMDGMSQPLHP